MKLFNSVLTGLLFVAVVFLYILHFNTRSVQHVADITNTNETKAEEVPVALIDSPAKVENKGIAYINSDTVLEKYQFAKDVLAKLLAKEKNAKNQLQASEAQFSKEYQAFMQKVQNRSFINELEAEEEQKKILSQQKKLSELNDNLTKQFMEEQKKMNKQLNDTIQNFFKSYNEEKHYQVIFCNTGNDNIIYADQAINITSDVIKRLNERYKKK